MIRWTLKKTIAATIQPVTLAEARSFMKMNDGETGQDDRISEMIAAATGLVEAFIKRQLLTATWRMRLNRFPCKGILVPMPPTQSVTVQYLDTAGTEQTWGASNYVLNTDADPAEITRAWSVSWPAIREDQYNSVTVTSVAGYGSAATDIPEPMRGAMKRAIMGWAETLMEFREDVLVGTIKSEAPDILWPWCSCFDRPWLV